MNDKYDDAAREWLDAHHAREPECGEHAGELGALAALLRRVAEERWTMCGNERSPGPWPDPASEVLIALWPWRGGEPLDVAMAQFFLGRRELLAPIVSWRERGSLQERLRLGADADRPADAR